MRFLNAAESDWEISGVSLVAIEGDVILKKPLKECESDYRQIFERDVRWHVNLHNESFSPNLLHADMHSCLFITEHPGEYLANWNKPRDGLDQCKFIMHRIKDLKLNQSDIERLQVFIKDGKFRFFDFTWDPNSWFHDGRKENCLFNSRCFFCIPG